MSKVGGEKKECALVREECGSAMMKATEEKCSMSAYRPKLTLLSPDAWQFRRATYSRYGCPLCYYLLLTPQRFPCFKHILYSVYSILLSSGVIANQSRATTVSVRGGNIEHGWLNLHVTTCQYSGKLSNLNVLCSKSKTFRPFQSAALMRHMYDTGF